MKDPIETLTTSLAARAK